MVRRNVVLPDDLDREFREAIMHRTGLNKGDFSEAIAEAIRLWLAAGDGQVAPAKKPHATPHRSRGTKPSQDS